MTFKTHRKIGEIAGILVPPVLIMTGIISSPVVALASLPVAWFASRRGSAIPDADQKTSAAGKSSVEAYLLRFVWGLFGVGHRSVTSHCVTLYILVWAMIMAALNIVAFPMMYALPFGEYLVFFTSLFILSYFVGILSHLASDALTKGGIYITPWGGKIGLPFFSVAQIDKATLKFSTFMFPIIKLISIGYVVLYFGMNFFTGLY